MQDDILSTRSFELTWVISLIMYLLAVADNLMYPLRRNPEFAGEFG